MVTTVCFAAMETEALMFSDGLSMAELLSGMAGLWIEPRVGSLPG